MEWDKLPLTVLKFGGSSVADSRGMRHVAQIVKKTREEGYRVAVVVSARETHATTCSRSRAT